MALHKREASSSGSSAAAGWPPADTSLSCYPDLLSFLGDTAWADGSGRTTGTLLVFAEEGVPKCCLSDRDGDLVCFVAAPGLIDLLAAADKAVTSPGADWRRRKPQAPRHGAPRK